MTVTKTQGRTIGAAIVLGLMASAFIWQANVKNTDTAIEIVIPEGREDDPTLKTMAAAATAMRTIAENMQEEEATDEH